MSYWMTVQQPNLFPPIYMIERFARCDAVVIMDGAQFDRDNSQFLLMGHDGARMQTVQLERAPHDALFNVRRVVRGDVWARKLLTAAQTNYGRQPHYAALRDWFTDVVTHMAQIERLTPFSAMSVRAVATLLGLKTFFPLGTHLVLERPADATEWLVEFCLTLGATDYIQGEKSMRSYIRKGPFENAGIRTWGQAFSLDYTSNGGRQGHAGLSILDLLFTQGVEETRRLLQVDKGPGSHGTSNIVTR